MTNLLRLHPVLIHLLFKNSKTHQHLCANKTRTAIHHSLPHALIIPGDDPCNSLESMMSFPYLQGMTLSVCNFV